jgi:Tfp pilus assembly protein PilO
MQRSILITLGGLMIAGAMVFFLVLPARARLQTLAAELNTLRDTLATVRADIAGTEQQRLKTAEVRSKHDALVRSGVLQPLLNSFAMRGKSLLDPLAQQTGFAIANVKEDRFLRLQVPKQVPLHLYGRQMIEFSGQGAYTSIVNFIALAEERFPLCTLAGLKIISQNQTPETHKAFITFEWPAKGEKRTP